MNAAIWLALAVVSAGLWSGLLLTVTTILHPMFATQDGPGFSADLRRFLPIARRSPTNYVLVVALVVAPAGAVWALWDARYQAPFVLTATGLGLTVIGAVLLSRFAAEPNYDVILGWDPVAPPGDWRAVRRRYFALNWARAVLVWAAFGCFLAATFTHAG